MNSIMESKENKYLKARERVAELKKFYNALATFIIVNLFFVLINYMSNGLAYAWFWWITISWAIGMAFYALNVFGFNLIFPKDWEQRKIREFMDREEGGYNKESGSKWE